MTGALRMVNKSVYSDDEEELEILRAIDFEYYKKIMKDRERKANKQERNNKKQIYDSLEDALF